MIVEIMGNKVGWLTLYAGIGGGADVILIPEIPYSIDAVVKCTGSCMNSKKKGYCVIAVSEGAIAQNEAHLSRKERMQKRAERDELTLSNSIAKAIADKLEVETRVVVPGHIQRGGGPNAYDRVICTQMGAYAAKLALEKRYGVTVAMNSDKMTANSLAEISKKTNFVPPKHELICAARDTGISFGD
jgi:6-phosphofructokinase 1